MPKRPPWSYLMTMPDEPLPESTLRRLLLDITLNRKSSASTAEEKAAHAALARDVAKIKKVGGIVDIPFDFPGPD